MSIEQFRKRIKQELLSKHAKFFAADKKVENPIFQGIRYLANGTAVVTNTHTLLRIKDVSPFTSPCTLHPITGAELNGVYPDNAIDDLLNWTSENRITLETTKQIAGATQFAKIAQMIAKELRSVKIVNLKLHGETASLELKDQGVEFTAPFGSLAKDQDETWFFDTDYMYNAFNLFKSALTVSLTIKLRHKYDSIVLSDEENGIDVLILPIYS